MESFTIGISSSRNPGFAQRGFCRKLQIDAFPFKHMRDADRTVPSCRRRLIDKRFEGVRIERNVTRELSLVSCRQGGFGQSTWFCAHSSVLTGICELEHRKSRCCRSGSCQLNSKESFPLTNLCLHRTCKHVFSKFGKGGGKIPMLLKEDRFHVICCSDKKLTPKEAAAQDPHDGVGVEIAVAVLRFYKREISPLIPASCRYVPTCSEYAIQAYRGYGVLKGTILTIWRLARCNPFGKSGFDPPRWFGEDRPPSI